MQLLLIGQYWRSGFCSLAHGSSDCCRVLVHRTRIKCVTFETRRRGYSTHSDCSGLAQSLSTVFVRDSSTPEVVFQSGSQYGGRDFSTDCDWPRRKVASLLRYIMELDGFMVNVKRSDELQHDIPRQMWVEKNQRSTKKWRWRCFSIAADSRRRPTYFSAAARWTIFGWRRRWDSAALGLSNMTKL